MSDRLVVNVTPFETRVAYIDSGVVTEIIIERNSEKGLVGNIYLGKVQRVLPGMQAAFIELGIGKAAFLFVDDVIKRDVFAETMEICPDTGLFLNKEEVASEEIIPADLGETIIADSGVVAETKIRPRERPKIEDLIKTGQELLVQVTKDPIGTKGPRVSCNISIPGRHVVFMPDYDHVGISKKIIDENERKRLKQLLTLKKEANFGFVARTVSQGVSDEHILKDCEYLVSLWKDIQNRLKKLTAPSLVHSELDILLKCARDMSHDFFHRIIIDNEADYLRVKKFLEIFQPSMCERIDFYDSKEPIFDHFGIETEINRAMNRKAWLRSGGYLVIDQAEALTVIDVNTGKFVGKRNLQDTILRTNLEAVKEVAYQLRLRNIGGVVIIDFIDMEEQLDRDKVLQLLVEELKKDKARCTVVKMSELGLVEMTRQRTRESLERRLCEPCYYCDGKGTLKSRLTISYEIYRDLLYKGPKLLEPNIIVHAHPEVVDLIYGSEHDYLEKIEQVINKHIMVRPRGSFHQEQFDIFGSSASK